MLPEVAGTTGANYHAQLFLLSWGLSNFWAGLIWNCNPPDLCLRADGVAQVVEPLCSKTETLSSNSNATKKEKRSQISVSDVARIIDVSNPLFEKILGKKL
jgi:hypothetical protein